MKKVLIALVVLLVVAAIASGVTWWVTQEKKPADHLSLFGNVDLRQVDLAFNNSERIVAVLVQEGDRLRAGELVARLDSSRLAPQVAQAEAQVSAQRAAVERLHNGSRPEEIAQARANLDSAKADAHNAQIRLDRVKSLAMVEARRAVSKQEVDDAQAGLDTTTAKVQVNQKALELALVGPRKEDIAQAEAQLKGNEAQLAFLRQQLADAELRSPTAAVVRSRLLEPGEMASPQRAVFSLAITDPKWVRAYASEVDLGKIRPGMRAAVMVDSFPGRRFEGWVGFISSVAEFTPKVVQTEELRTKLVYEVRVFVKDPGDELRLGSPATVELPLTGTAAGGPTTAPAPVPSTSPEGSAP
jgi:HlyD family secretion protein